MAVVTAPEGAFTGTVAGVAFVDGVAETSNTWALAYFARHGYDVNDVYADSLTWSETKDPVTMTIDDLRAFAAAKSVDLSGLTRKQDIVDRINLPIAPAKPTVTPGDTQASVAYTAPSYTGT
jgi:hypothetical protein